MSTAAQTMAQAPDQAKQPHPIIELLQRYGISVSGKDCVVLGR